MPTQPTPEKSKETLEAKSAFSATLLNIGGTHASPLVERAHTITENASALEKQQAELESHTAALAKQNESWDKLAGEARDGLKEIGDVQNWAEVVERELLVLEQTLQYVEGSDDRDHGDEIDDDDEDVNGGDGLNGSITRNGTGKGKGSTDSTDSTSAVEDGGGTTTTTTGNGSGGSSWFKWW
ncbi:hypothetical protein AnigIFM59636_000009 [Aspergillus niger]|nr:hypothetical protein AnigIFM59636_000009 [Aspergillus niger]